MSTKLRSAGEQEVLLGLGGLIFLGAATLSQPSPSCS
jgi:hypothetical protein